MKWSTESPSHNDKRKRKFFTWVPFRFDMDYYWLERLEVKELFDTWESKWLIYEIRRCKDILKGKAFKKKTWRQFS